MARLYVSEEVAKAVKVAAAADGVSMQAWVESRLVGESPAAPVARSAGTASIPPAPRVTPIARDVAVSFDVPTARQTMLECIEEKVASIGQDRPRTQPVAKESPFEARAHKRKGPPKYVTNEFGDVMEVEE